MFIFKIFNLSALGFGGSMALIDAFILSSIKAYSLGWIKWRGVIIIAMLVYAFQPLIFLESLNVGSLIVMNLLWDVMSDVLVTVFGIVYFKEKLSNVKMLGVVLSFISLVLLSWKEPV